MITLRWAPFPGSDVASYKIWRSIIGVTVTLPVNPADIFGTTLVIRANCHTFPTTITFAGGNPVDEINAVAQGFRAYNSSTDPDQMIIRSDIREAPGSLQIVGGTALELLGLTARTVTEKSEDRLIATMPADPDPEAMLEYQDPDGTVQDWYAISTIDSLNNESRKSGYKQPITSTGPVCSIEGIITDLQGIRVPDAEISAKLIQFPHSPESASHVTLEPVTTRTGSDGRFSLVLLQGALVDLSIPAIGYGRAIRVPEKSYVFVTDLFVDLDYQFPLGYLNAPGSPSKDTEI